MSMCDFVSGVIDEMQYTLLSLNLDEEICLITNFGRRGIGKGEFGNKGRACLFLLKVSFDKVDSSVDLVFLNLFLHLEHVLDDFLKAVSKRSFDQRRNGEFGEFGLGLLQVHTGLFVILSSRTRRSTLILPWKVPELRTLPPSSM